MKAGSVRRCAIGDVSSFGAIAILLSALAPTVAAETGAADEPPRAAALDAIFAEYSEGRSPGVSVGVLWNGRTFARGYGYADLEQDVPITPDTVFHVASVSKQFTAFSAALVAADGALDLDADIRSVLPEVPDFRAADAAMGPITPRQLVYHTSGLRDQWTLFALGGMGLDNRLRQQQILRMVARQEALNFPPGTDYTYSNTGYTLLAELVQRTSGKSFAEFAEARIFQPLGMTSTLFYDDVTELVPRRAHSYEREGKGGWRRSLLNFDNVGATSLHTTAPDLLKWAQNILEPSVGAGFAMGELMRMGRLDDGTAMNYGFGLQTMEVVGHRAIWHSGSDAGFRSIFAVFPDDAFAVVILSNASANLMAPLAAVTSLYLRDDPEAWRADLPAAAPRPRDVEKFLGHYAAPNRPAMSLSVDGGKVVMKFAGEDVRPVTFREDGSLDLGDEERAWGVHYRPILEGGRVTALEELGAAVVEGRHAVFTRYEPVRPGAAELAALAGRYRNGELEVVWELAVEDGELYMESLWSERYPLRPVTTDRFSGRWPMHDVRVERGARGRPVALVVSSERARGVRFVREE